MLTIQKTYGIGEVIKKLKVSHATIRKWTNEGRLKSSRTKGGHRRFTNEDLQELNAWRSELDHWTQVKRYAIDQIHSLRNKYK